jgi:flagellar biosynthetic protein FlhB
MAEDSDLEKTEPASEKRLEQAREEGDVPRSRELSTCTILLAAGGALWAMGGTLVQQLNKNLITGLTLEREAAFDFNLLIGKIGVNLLDVLLAFSPSYWCCCWWHWARPVDWWLVVQC